MSDGPARKPTAEALARTAWFYDYVRRLDEQPDDLPVRCPCCFCRTIEERGTYEICAVCFWEDDGQDDYDADIVRRGPNGVSLTEARANYLAFGASEARRIDLVRLPRREELPGEDITASAAPDKQEGPQPDAPVRGFMRRIAHHFISRLRGLERAE